ncbi:TonB-dependent receptor plug domain-containing protein [Massilia antarctica]|uniref:TonB-dependent receptor plug domain-containing protein n=1 Tax=Massilia antarctica TaxID=2765360 RepID=UPI0006BB8531|nr:TonB-dependent receptor [Massilia sp. H27-R4]MCY0910553.1 TonB-dependent receptor [Massilia sp. H27-R4]CUI09089.1 TonB-dependent receptor; Outer membrane receptor for ferrienterochelin and colicins [Janthinobacterium sp. CG23_2]CUU32875.1 TonB-dependent receptor; Outer membrane receptor for ferrienterochelin and colicins [Janthinobacterium sp. CG23_2]
MRRLPFLIHFIACALLLHGAGAHANVDQLSLLDFSLEQLSDIVVSSVSRQPARLADAPVSLYVIAGADIARAGARSLPEALRLAPNLQVARSDGGTYAITARGFASTIENKLLVLIDGRSVYSPLFSGVFWDTQDVVMEDIARIEVISGPGPTIWGANAVNGVINIITRNAADSQGVLLALDGGRRERGATVRQGGKLDGGGLYRVYAKAGQVDDFADYPGGGLERRQAGFRGDWKSATRSTSVSADVYRSSAHRRGGGETRSSGANLLGRTNGTLADGSDWRIQASLDHSERVQPGTGAQRLDIVDLDMQHGTRLGESHSLVWGGGYRHAWDRVSGGTLLAFFPADKNLNWANVFAQDKMQLSSTLRMSIGVKLEHNTYTGTETLPSARMVWNASPSSVLWAAVSRNVRAPARLDRDLYWRGAGGGYSIEGGPDFVAETVRVAEMGYRAQPLPSVSYSLTVFASDYQRLRTLEPRAPAPGAPTPGAQFANLGDANTRGLEFWSRWQAAPRWRLVAGLVLQDIDPGRAPDSRDISDALGIGTNDPSSYWSLRSSHELSDQLQAELALRRVGQLPQPLVPAYYELDLRMAWQPNPNMEVALSGQNLLHRAHAEFGPAATRRLIERTVSLQLSSRF